MASNILKFLRTWSMPLIMIKYLAIMMIGFSLDSEIILDLAPFILIVICGLYLAVMTILSAFTD